MSLFAIIVVCPHPTMISTMKQEDSFLKWASSVLGEPVSNIKAVQDVVFVKRLLSRIDDLYFQDWGTGQQSYTQVLQAIGKYYREEIGTDISQHLQGLNVYKNVREVWELLLGIAIKGGNRSNNINLIFQMDQAVQAELVKIVTDIIEKFGQNTATVEEQPDEEVNTNNERQMMVEMAQENQILREECARLQEELLREKHDRAAATTARKELQHNLEMMRLEKFAFFEVMANANRSNSRIFDDGDGGHLQTQANLSQVAQDIVQFVRQQRKTIQGEAQRNSVLEEQVKELRETLRRCAEQNQIYIMKLGDLNLYQREIQGLRDELAQKQEWNLQLMEQVSTLEEEKANLLINLQRRAIEITKDNKKGLQESELQEVKPYQQPKQREKRLLRKQTIKGQQRNQQSFNSQGEGPLGDSSYVPSSEKDEAIRRQMQDELRQPQLRTKLQREVVFLKKTNNSLTKQIQALKRTNEALQRSTKTFLDNNQQVINRWEQDYEAIIDKMGALTKINEDLKEENTHKEEKNQQLANKLKAKEEEKAKKQQSRVAAASQIFQNGDDSIDSRSDSEKSSNQVEITVNSPPKPSLSKQEQAKIDKTVLWDQIVQRLREIIRQGKTKELAYESSLQGLRNQNLKLLQLLKNRTTSQQVQPHQQTNISEIEMKADSSHNYFLNMQRVDSEEVRGDRQVPQAPPKLSYLQIQEGDQLQESVVSRLRQKSNFFGVNSRIVNGFNERRAQPSFTNNGESYYNLNRRMTSSIRESFKGLASRIEHDPSGSVQLQRRMEEEIQSIGKQYQRLNSHYQSVFNKLHIYTENLKEKQSMKEGYQQVLKEISKAEEQVKATHQAEIVQLRILNQGLKQQVTECIIEKQQFASYLNQLATSVAALKANEEKKQQATFKEVQRAITQAGTRFNTSLKDPLSFLDSCLEGTKEQGQLQKFYRLYMRQRQRTQQLNEQIQLLSGALLEYRNMMLS